MIRFAHLFHAIDATTKTNEKIAALVQYFSVANPSDAAWAVYFLCGNKLKAIVPTKRLRGWAARSAGIPEWLFQESYHAIGDLAETIALIVPPGKGLQEISLTDWIENRLQPLRRVNEQEQQQAVEKIWSDTSPEIRLVVMKLITGSFRVGVSKRLVTKALAKYSDVAVDVIAHRLMGNWTPSPASFAQLIDRESQQERLSQPYPFCLAHGLENTSGPAALGDIQHYVAEWKWDGIRGQVIRRQAQTFIWSRGEELMENRWPEIETAAAGLPDGTVLDGEILATTADGQVMPFAELQRRINRKTLTKRLLAEVPVTFQAFDLLERDGQDIRTLPFQQRRADLESVIATIADPSLCVTQVIQAQSWSALANIRTHSRARKAEGLMLKRQDSTYEVGRVRGTWWKWKIDPYRIDAVLIYAQKGHGKRASLYTDYTFALWDGPNLVPVAKAYSGLDDKEIAAVDRFIRQNTTESFGPVRSVTPSLVMEIAFEGISRSARHKSGIATRFPRIARWRQDKQPTDANTLQELIELLPES